MLGDCVDCEVNLIGKLCCYHRGEIRCPDCQQNFNRFHDEAPTEEIDFPSEPMDSEEYEEASADASFTETYWNNLTKECL